VPCFISLLPCAYQIIIIIIIIIIITIIIADGLGENSYDNDTQFSSLFVSVYPTTLSYYADLICPTAVSRAVQ